ncbi:outer membrane protein (plasmid) [Helicobacter bizzozeronii CIII-1]|uniref:Outer membrane protein n=1 Tax=Helicobacter bizzozeronii (strain CIII-1) TaxID=1002804 RepID=F8KUM2_HELBC|nr:outer membrane protein [Helicobacter bizzozeronii CIII-1]
MQELIQAKQQEIEQEYITTLVASGDTLQQAETYKNDHIASFYAYAKSAVESELPHGIPVSTKAPYGGNLFGIDLQAGYKQFFGKKKHWGVRYYVLFSAQGGTYYNKKGGYNQSSGNLFYGVGADALYNFYQKRHKTYGVFAGLMIGGSSWFMGGAKNASGACIYTSNGKCVSMNDYYGNLTSTNDGNVSRASFSPTFVQFLINIGFRTNFTRHQGFEVGMRIPTIDDPYFKITYIEMGPWGNKGTWKNLTFRRNVAIYANYVYNF